MSCVPLNCQPETSSSVGGEFYICLKRGKTTFAQRGERPGAGSPWLSPSHPGLWTRVCLTFVSGRCFWQMKSLLRAPAGETSGSVPRGLPEPSFLVRRPAAVLPVTLLS